MNNKSRNAKIAKMRQYDLKINLDSTGNVTGKQV